MEMLIRNCLHRRGFFISSADDWDNNILDFSLVLFQLFCRRLRRPSLCRGLAPFLLLCGNFFIVLVVSKPGVKCYIFGNSYAEKSEIKYAFLTKNAAILCMPEMDHTNSFHEKLQLFR
jgi:hypothetical protein